MRKILSLVLALILVLTVLPMSVLAAEENTSDRDLALAQACELFPEHSAVIMNQGISTFSLTPSDQEKVKVFEETRYYSDDLSITYTEFNDGTAYIIKTGYTKNVIPVKSEFIDAYRMQCTCNMEVYYNQKPTSKLVVNGIVFIYEINAFDQITNVGRVSSDSIDRVGTPTVRRNSDSVHPAYVEYYADFPETNMTYEYFVRFCVQRGKTYIELDTMPANY